MPNYQYKALTNLGKHEQGVLQANSRMEALEILQQQKKYPVTVQETTSKDLKTVRFSKKTNVKDLAVFCRQFYTMLNSGISIIKCLEILREQVENTRLKAALANVYEEVQKGAMLSAAMQKHTVFPELFTQMVIAGETSGTLDLLMDRMAVTYEKEFKINNKIQTAMIYPIILCILAISAVVILLTTVMPTFVSLFKTSGVELPLPTRIVMGASDALRSYWYLILMVIGGLTFLVNRVISSEKGRYAFHAFQLRIPVVGKAIQRIYTARFTRTLGTLLTSGISLIPSLEGAAGVVGNVVVSTGIKQIVEEIREGVSLSDLIHKTGLFPPMVDSMILIGEESGTLEMILDKTANFYDEEAETYLQKVVSMVEPLFIIIMAVIIGFIVIAILMPVFDLSKTG
ncbi:MAG: type II secretion system F family protein [Desulfosporosinus sp.]|nr:type II secretion system F family protein [Desulfosporosinus sp.]